MNDQRRLIRIEDAFLCKASDFCPVVLEGVDGSSMNHDPATLRKLRISWNGKSSLKHHLSKHRWVHPTHLGHLLTLMSWCKPNRGKLKLKLQRCGHGYWMITACSLLESSSRMDDVDGKSGETHRGRPDVCSRAQRHPQFTWSYRQLANDNP